MAPAFSLAADPQLSSNLFQRLPEEMRLKIFEYLLSPSAFARADGRFIELDSPDDCAHLSTQALQVCQQMYTECEHLLYTRNKLQIVIEAGRITVADAVLYIKYKRGKQSNIFRIDDHESLTLTQYAARLAAEDPENELRPRLLGPQNWHIDTLPGMTKMQVIDVHLRCSSRREIYDFIRLMRDNVSNKRVTIIWELKHTVKERRAIDLIRTFHLWRCETLKFLDLPHNLLATAAIMTSLVASSIPPTDLWLEVNTRLKSAILPAVVRWEFSSNIANYDSDSDTDTDNTKATHALSTRMTLHQALKSHRIQISDIDWLWTIIRQGDTVKFAIWEAEFEAYTNRIAETTWEEEAAKTKQ